MNNELEATYQSLQKAERAEDIFGLLSGLDKEAQKERVNAIYRQLAKILHPDRYPHNSTDHKMAADAFPMLSAFYERAKTRIDKEIYGSNAPDEEEEEIDFIIKTRQREYHLRSTLAEGDLSIIYKGDFTSETGEVVPIVAKVIDDPADNDLAQNEIKVLKLLVGQPNRYSKYLPTFYDQFKTTDGQFGLILGYLADCYDLYSVREKYKDGVAEKHMVWILNRLLTVLGYAHSKGIVHGNIEPAHLMIRPKDHNLFLIDWSYAAVNPFQTGDKFKVFNEDYSPPEVAERKKPIPASDLYSVGKCMIFLLGGDVKTNRIPSHVNEKLQRLIKYFTLPSPLQRAQDAWQMHEQLDKLVVELWGPKKFLKFEM
jgi:serine/threonine protein kinase